MYRLKVSDSHYTEIGGNIYKMKCKGVSGSSFKILLLFYRFLKISSYHQRKKKCVLLYGRASCQHYWCQTAACQWATRALHYDCPPRGLHWAKLKPLTLTAVDHPDGLEEYNWGWSTMPLCSCTINFNDVLRNINKLVHEALAVHLGQDATLVVVSVGKIIH